MEPSWAAVFPFKCVRESGADLETQVETELTTFEGVNGVRIDGMACSRVGDESGDAVVRCQGKIVADYGAESNEFPLTTYRAKQENGVWKWCGEQAP